VLPVIFIMQSDSVNDVEKTKSGSPEPQAVGVPNSGCYTQGDFKNTQYNRLFINESSSIYQGETIKDQCDTSNKVSLILQEKDHTVYATG